MQIAPFLCALRLDHQTATGTKAFLLSFWTEDAAGIGPKWIAGTYAQV